MTKTIFISYDVNRFKDKMVKDEKTGSIFVTQPRRIAAISIAERVASKRSHKEFVENDVGKKEPVVRGWGNVGYGLIGYQVGLERMIHEDCRITYMTPAIVTNRMQSDRILDGVKYLIIDEVHERDLDTEMLLLLASNLLKQNNVMGLSLIGVVKNVVTGAVPGTVSDEGTIVKPIKRNQTDPDVSDH